MSRSNLPELTTPQECAKKILRYQFVGFGTELAVTDTVTSPEKAKLSEREGRKAAGPRSISVTLSEMLADSRAAESDKVVVSLSCLRDERYCLVVQKARDLRPFRMSLRGTESNAHFLTA